MVHHCLELVKTAGKWPGPVLNLGEDETSVILVRRPMEDKPRTYPERSKVLGMIHVSWHAEGPWLSHDRAGRR